MDRKFVIAWLAVFLAWFGGSFLVHGVLLHDDYAMLPNLFRPEAESNGLMLWMSLAHVMLSGAFTWIYTRGLEAKPWLPQGLRFGLGVACLTTIPTYMIYYVVQPMPGMVVVKQTIFDSALMLVLGILVAFLYRNGRQGAA